jgi:uncharacterized protein HemX
MGSPVNPKAAALIFLAAVAILGFAAWIAVRRTAVQHVRRRDLRAADDTIAAIEEVTDQYADIDHVIAAQVKDLIRAHRKEQRSRP